MKILVGFSMDVNVVVLGEFFFGEVRNFDSCLYIMIGIGIGVGVIVEGWFFQGLLYLEMGYIYI